MKKIQQSKQAASPICQTERVLILSVEFVCVITLKVEGITEASYGDKIRVGGAGIWRVSSMDNTVVTAG